MAIKKSVLYSSLWASCDQLRGAGSMDASQYKDYVLTMLFLKYTSDKYAGQTDPIIEIPEGHSFQDLAQAKGKPDIGERINVALRAIARENGLEQKLSLADFEKDELLGSGKEKVALLTKLIAIFENPALDFQNNRAEDDDLLGDAYEYLMRHFATQSGKSKGQFYTPAEVSRVLAKLVQADRAQNRRFSVYDMTCGSGSLLLKVAHEAPVPVSLYGQEKDYSTSSLAVMNMFLHGNPSAEITRGNTLSDPKFFENKSKDLKRFDVCVANPPFSQKNWAMGFNPSNDKHQRFKGFGVPPDKNGDYAFLLHLLRSMKSDGKGAIILPHGVLFRGNAESVIRQNLVERRWIKGIIGLPPNLFYGTGIPACIIVLDKENTEAREGIFMVDASKGYVKDGNKNRLREQDIHKIVDTFTQQLDTPRYARLVPWDEIAEQEYNLNLPRYIDTQTPEDQQDLQAHLKGGIPQADLDALAEYWTAYPQLQTSLLAPLRPGYQQLLLPKDQLKPHIEAHPEFIHHQTTLQGIFESWSAQCLPQLNSIDAQTKPKQLIHELSERLLQAYQGRPLVDAYAIYQHLMDYWNASFKDDVYLVVEEGWTPSVELIPLPLVIDTQLTEQKAELQALQAEAEALEADLDNFLEEHSKEEEDALYEVTKPSEAKEKLQDYLQAAGSRYLGIELDEAIEQAVAKEQAQLDALKSEIIAVNNRLMLKYKNSLLIDELIQTKNYVDEDIKALAKLRKQNKPINEKRIASKTITAFQKQVNALLQPHETRDELKEISLIEQYLAQNTALSTQNKAITKATKALDQAALACLQQLDATTTQTLVVQHKWLHELQTRIQEATGTIAQQLTARLQTLATRYQTPLQELDAQVTTLEKTVLHHLQTMGLS